MKKSFLIASVNKYYNKNLKSKKYKFYFINKKKKLNLKYLNKIKPNIIFFPYWHWKVKKKILDKFLCIGFHTSELPYGRGGSPIQNQILRGHKNTKICAIKYNEKIDSGDIYLREKVSLTGSGNFIFNKIFKKISFMIFKLIKKLPKPKKQKGKLVIFKRRKPEDSEIKNIKDINKLYDFIRMLDIDFKNFPKAFIRFEKYKFIFSGVKYIKKKQLACKLTIRED